MGGGLIRDVMIIKDVTFVLVLTQFAARSGGNGTEEGGEA